LVIGVVSVAGAFLSLWFGWLSTTVIIVLYGMAEIVRGFIERQSIRDA
jgi:hypothetical protein